MVKWAFESGCRGVAKILYVFRLFGCNLSWGRTGARRVIYGVVPQVASARGRQADGRAGGMPEMLAGVPKCPVPVSARSAPVTHSLADNFGTGYLLKRPLNIVPTSTTTFFSHISTPLRLDTKSCLSFRRKMRKQIPQGRLAPTYIQHWTGLI